MSRLGSLYIRLGKPEGESAGCCELSDWAADLIEQHEAEIVRLRDSREREGDRLDWLLARISGAELRRLVGEMGCTSDVSEWRDKIDKAMGYKTI